MIVQNTKNRTLIDSLDFKFGSFGVVDIGPCKARTKLIKWCENEERKPIRLTIEAEFDGGIFSGYDGVGQEFTIKINKVTVYV